MDLERFDQIIQNKKVLVWDFDGTIAKLHVDWYAVKEDLRALLTKDQQVEHERLGETIAKLDAAGLHDDAFAVLEKHESEADYTVLEDARRFIQERHQDFTMVVFTDNLTSTIERVLKAEGLYAYFSHIITKDDVTEYKPAPEGLAIAQQKTSAEKDAMLMIGDSSNDEGAAKSFGVDFFSVL